MSPPNCLPPSGLPDRLHPDRQLDQADDQGPRNPLWDRIHAVVDQFGHSPPSRTRSRRHGYQPHAREHVETYLRHTVLGHSGRQIARETGRHHSTIAASIERGRQLVQLGAETHGFDDPHPPAAVDPWDIAQLDD